MKRKVKLILGITSLYDKDKEFYNHFTKNFRSPDDPGGPRFYLSKVFQDIAAGVYYYGAYFGIIGGFLCTGRPYRKFSTYKFKFLIGERLVL